MQHLFRNNSCIFQQDNAPCHTAATVKKWLHNNNVKNIPWPGNSSDMNPMENAWDFTLAKIDATKDENAQELLSRIMEEWNSVQGPCIKELLDSMPRQVNTVILANGCSTKY